MSMTRYFEVLIFAPSLIIHYIVQALVGADLLFDKDFNDGKNLVSTEQLKKVMDEEAGMQATLDDQVSYSITRFITLLIFKR